MPSAGLSPAAAAATGAALALASVLTVIITRGGDREVTRRKAAAAVASVVDLHVILAVSHMVAHPMTAMIMMVVSPRTQDKMALPSTAAAAAAPSTVLSSSPHATRRTEFALLNCDGYLPGGGRVAMPGLGVSSQRRRLPG
jgi:hypothetical protein